MKFLIVTTEPKTLYWKTLPAKLAAIRTALGTSWEVSIILTDTKPLILNGRVDHSWYKIFIKDYLSQGYDVVGLHMSNSQKTTWGLKESLRGSNFVSGDFYGDFYFWADENTKRESWNQFVQTCLHEFSHEYFQKTGLTDITHEYHNKNKNIIPLFKTFDWKQYQNTILLGKKNWLQNLVATLKAAVAPPKPTALLHPVENYKTYVSQKWGTPNGKLYPRTGVHIGTDYACPQGTPVLAPCDGKVTASGFSQSMGNFCYFQYTYGGETFVARFMHLLEAPIQTTYKRGEVLELSGNTGMSTGAHLHVDLWRNEVRVDLLTKTNWSKLTIDPQKHYV